jgi:hypothetical protein
MPVRAPPFDAGHPPPKLADIRKRFLRYIAKPFFTGKESSPRTPAVRPNRDLRTMKFGGGKHEPN